MIRHLAFAAALTLAPAAAAAAQGAAPANAPATPVTRAQLNARLEADYTNLDSNKDGKVGADEIKARLKKGAETELATLSKERDATFASLDANKDGSISRVEFNAKAELPKIGEPDAAPVLARFDGNKDGQITRDEFRGPTLANFDKLDADKDGTLSLNEQSAARKAQQTPAIRR